MVLVSGSAGAAVVSGGVVSVTPASMGGSSTAVAPLIGIVFDGGFVVDFAIIFSGAACMWRASRCFGVLGCSIT